MIQLKSVFLTFGFATSLFATLQASAEAESCKAVFNEISLAKASQVTLQDLQKLAPDNSRTKENFPLFVIGILQSFENNYGPRTFKVQEKELKTTWADFKKEMLKKSKTLMNCFFWSETNLKNLVRR